MSNFKFHSSLGIRSLGILIVPVGFMNKSFTLLEIIVVVVIAGIIATFAVPGYFGAVERSKNAEARALLRGFDSQMHQKQLELEVGCNWFPVGTFRDLFPYRGRGICPGYGTDDWCYDASVICGPPTDYRAIAIRNVNIGDTRGRMLIYDGRGNFTCTPWGWGGPSKWCH